jgi:predicted amidohydrolase YtcJ
MTATILTAGSIITMDEVVPRAEAIAFEDDTIIAVGSVEHCRQVVGAVPVIDSGAAVLMPGFIDPHSHPLLSGISTQAPAVAIAPWVADSWAGVLKIFTDVCASSDPALPLVFTGFDALLHGHPAPDAAELDQIFGDRVVVVADNSGHATYFTSALIRRNHWDSEVSADPVGGRFGRTSDGALNGIAYEVPANTMVLGPVLTQLGGNILSSAAEYFALMARSGITSTSDMTYSDQVKAGYEALAALPSHPLRVSMWHVSTAPDYLDQVEFAAGDKLLIKQGVKLWTDGSPWIGNVALSFPYLDTETTKIAGIDPATAGGIDSLNYGAEQVAAILDHSAPLGWQMSFHCNGDLAVDFALDAYEAALNRHGLIGTDHRWRIEHVGGARTEQFERAARLGVHISMAPFQYYYWGDLLDGEMFDHEHGSEWQAIHEAVAAGACVTLHNDGSVSPPTPLLNIQTAVSRRTRSGAVHGPEQRITIEEALKAHTINAARTLHREQLVGSLAPGKLADFVELSADPYQVDPVDLARQVIVHGTWLGGRRVDLDEFLQAAGAQDPAPHEHLRARGHAACC